MKSLKFINFKTALEWQHSISLLTFHFSNFIKLNQVTDRTKNDIPLKDTDWLQEFFHITEYATRKIAKNVLFCGKKLL